MSAVHAFQTNKTLEGFRMWLSHREPSAEETLGTDWMVNGTDYKSEIKFYKAQQCVLNTGNTVGNGDKVGKSVECS